MKKYIVIAVLVSCCVFLTACGSEREVEMEKFFSSENTLSDIGDTSQEVSVPQSGTGSRETASYEISASQQTISVSEERIRFNIPTENAVKLTFVRSVGLRQLVDTTENKASIEKIIQKLNTIEFSRTNVTKEYIQQRNGGSSSVSIEYADGSRQTLAERGWYQLNDQEEWFSMRGNVDWQQFVADEMGVKLWG